MLTVIMGIALSVRGVTGRLGLAALMGASAAWFGFFAYRFNHPAFFSLCYAPWILYVWLRAAEESAPRRVARWAYVARPFHALLVASTRRKYARAGS